MDKLKQWVALTVVGVMGIMAAGWFLLVSPKRSEAAELKAAAATQESANRTLQTQLTQLKAQAKALPKEEAKLAAVAAKIPPNRALPALIRALTTASAAAGVELISVAPAAGQPVVAAGPVAPVAAKRATADASKDATKDTTTKAPAARGTTASTAGASGAYGTLVAIPVKLEVAGGYFQVEQFLANLENLPRSMRVVGLEVLPGVNPVKPGTKDLAKRGGALISTVNAQVYMAVSNAAAATGVTAAGAAATTVPVAPAPSGTTPR